MRETFGQLLARLRQDARVRYARRVNGVAWEVVDRLSQNELARRADVDPAYVHHLEDGRRTTPKRAVVLRLAEALEVDDEGRARLLIAAGYWPWIEDGAVDAELVITTALAVAAGDYRQLGAPT